MKHLWLFGLTFCIHLSCSVVFGHSDHPKLLLMSFDGFRWDYLDVVKATGRQTPNFDKLIADGVLATVKNSFVTKTFPNHYTIVTGMYEENHGMVGNNMYDPIMKEEFTNTEEQSKDSMWWNNGTEDWPGEPIWIRNEVAGEHALFARRSGVYFWPGSEAAINGRHPTHYKRYNSSVPFKQRLDSIISWFKDDVSPINLGVLYYEEPDSTGHHSGPKSDALYDVVVELDGLLGYVLQQMEDNHLLHSVNIILTSDHGMVEIQDIKYLEDYVNVSHFVAYGHSPVMNIEPKQGFEDSVYDALSAAPDLHVFKKEEIPDQYHYRQNNRVQSLIVSAHVGSDLCMTKEDCWLQKGNHGYNNSLQQMHPIFIARGPAFKSGYRSPMFNNVDIYSLMCEILDMEPAQNDGNFENVRSMLAVHDNSTQTLITYLLVIAFAASVTGIFTVSALRIQRVRQRKLVHVFKTPGLESHDPLLESEEEEIP